MQVSMTARSNDQILRKRKLPGKEAAGVPVQLSSKLYQRLKLAAEEPGSFGFFLGFFWDGYRGFFWGSCLVKLRKSISVHSLYLTAKEGY